MVRKWNCRALAALLAVFMLTACSDDADDDGDGGDDGGGTHTDDTATSTVIGGCQVLPTNHIFNSRIDGLPVHPSSDAFLTTIGNTRRVHLDLGTEEDSTSDEYYGIPFNVVDGSTLSWTTTTYAEADMAEESDCTSAADATHAVVSPCTVTQGQTAFPIPASPLIEGGLSEEFPADGDHHLLVIDSSTCVLWELGEAVRPDGWRSNWSAAFDLASNALRPAGWTSADAAGFPILPLLLRAGEADSGEIRHALRFTINSGKIRNSYVWPARHRTSVGTGSTNLPQMGQLFRLKDDVAAPSGAGTQAQAILTALKRYGMYVADGGSDMYITGTPDARWTENTLDVVQSLHAEDFEAVDMSAVTERTGFDPDSGAMPAE